MLMFYLVLLYGANSIPLDLFEPSLQQNTFEGANLLLQIKANPSKFLLQLQKLDPEVLREVLVLLEGLLESSETRETHLRGELTSANTALSSADTAVVDAEDVLKTAKEAEALAEAAVTAAQTDLDHKKTDRVGKKSAKKLAQDNQDEELPGLDNDQRVLREVIAAIKGLIPTEVPTEVATEAVTTAPTLPPTQSPTLPPTQSPTQAVTQAPVSEDPVFSVTYEEPEQDFVNRCDSASVDLSSLPTSSYSIFASAMPRATGRNPIVGWGNYGVNYESNRLVLFPPSGIHARWWGEDWHVDDPSVNFMDGEFHEFGVSFDAETLKQTLWFNGELFGERTAPQAPLFTQENFCVGKTSLGTFNGKIEWVRIYNTYIDRTATTFSSNISTDNPDGTPFINGYTYGNANEESQNGYFEPCLHGVGRGLTIEECAQKCNNNDFVCTVQNCNGKAEKLEKYNQPLFCDAFEVYIPGWDNGDRTGGCHLQNYENNKEFCGTTWTNVDRAYYYERNVQREA